MGLDGEDHFIVDMTDLGKVPSDDETEALEFGMKDDGCFLDEDRSRGL